MAEILSAVAQYYEDGFHPTFAQVVDARLDNSLFAERKQRLERTHPVRPASGEDYCCNVMHCDLGLEITQCAQGVLTRHLLAPLINKIGVIEWPRFHVSGFRGGADLLVD